MRRWQREMILDLNRKANQPCTCENNGDLCDRCDARDQLSKPLVAGGTIIMGQADLTVID